MIVQKPRICIIMFSNLKGEPRVRNQINALRDRFSVITLGLRKSYIQGVKEFIITDKRSLGKRLKSRLLFILARLFNHLYFQYSRLKYPINEIIKMLSGEKFDLLIAHGLEALIVAEKIALRDDAYILLDTHEYEPRRIEDHWFHRLFVNPYKDFLSKNYLPFVDAMTTSSYGFAEEYHKRYGVEPDVIMNTPVYKNFSLKKTAPNNIQLIHHGIAHPSRKLENMIRLMPLLDKRYNLTLLLVWKNNYMEYLKRLSAKMCPGRVIFRDPVAFEKIVPTIAKYDIGLVIIEPTSLKLKYALPNKLFESIMAGLCVVAGPSTDMKKIIEEFNCGFVADSFNIEDIAEMINSLTIKDIMEKKKASLKAAKVLNAKKEMEKFNVIVEDLIGN
jgi:glycosyltransferase involved in cell wall biosynthesis